MKSFVVTVVAFISLSPFVFNVQLSKPSPCDDPSWKKHNDKCYKVIERRMSFGEAVDACATSVYGSLAILNSNGETNFIRDRFFPEYLGHQMWIGGMRVGTWNIKNHSFVWVGGEKFGYHNWDKGEPNNHNRFEYCVATASLGSKPEAWFDTRCDMRYYALCQNDLKNAPGLQKSKSAADMLLSNEVENLSQLKQGAQDALDSVKSSVTICTVFLIITIIAIGIIAVLGDFSETKIFLQRHSPRMFSRF